MGDILLNNLTNKVSVSNDGNNIGIAAPGIGSSTLSDQQQLIYVSKAGSDVNDGLNLQEAKQTIAGALTAAIALTPTENNQVTIQIVDTGTYTETFTQPEWIHIHGLLASIDGEVDIADNCILKIRRLQHTAANGACVSKTNGTGLSKVEADIMIVASSTNDGIFVKSGQIGCTIGTISCTGGNALLARAGSRLVFDVQYMRLMSSGRGLLTSTTGGSANYFSGNILLVDDDGTGRFIRTVASNDSVNIQGGSFLVNQLYDMGMDSTLNLYAHQVTGSRAAVATAQINIVDTSGDSNLQGDLNVEGDLTVVGNIQGFKSGSFKIVASFDDIAEFKTGSVYNLPEAAYYWAATLDFGTDSINLNDANGIYMFYGANFKQLTYTGTTPFIGTDKTGVSIDFIRIFLTTPNATCLKLQNGNSCILEFPVFANCKICVDLDNMAFCTADKLAMVGCEKGLILNDVLTCSVQVGQWSNGQDLSGIAFDLSGSASERFFMTSSDSRPTTTECFINVQASYGGLVDLAAGVHTPGGGDFFTTAGRDQNDKDVSVTAIQFVTPSKSTAAVHITPGNEASTSISVGVETVIDGTYTEDIAQRFTTTSAGLITYTGNETQVFGFAMKCLGVPASGNNRDYSFYIRHTAFIGTVETLIPISFDPINADAGTPAKVICIGDVILSTGDFLEPIVIGVGHSIDVTCSGLAFIVGP